MRAEVTPAMVLRAAEDCAFPAVTLGASVLSDAGAWQWAAKAATPAERAELLLQLSNELLRVTSGGRARLAAQAERPRDVDDEPGYWGDPELLPIVRAGLVTMPPVVRYQLVREVAWLGIATSRGWTIRAPFVDSAGREKDRVVVLGPTADAETVLHEGAHVWLSPFGPDPVAQPVTALGEAQFEALAERGGWRPRLDRWRATEERRACTLACVWALIPVEGRPA